MPAARHLLNALLLVSLAACAPQGASGGAPSPNPPGPTPPTSSPVPPTPPPTATPSPPPAPTPPSPTPPPPSPPPTSTPVPPSPPPVTPEPAPTPAPSPTPTPPSTGGPNSLLSVPPSMRAAPFNVERRLNIPTGFSIAVYARVPGARFLLALPDGGLLVSQPGAGQVTLLRPGAAGADPSASVFASGLASPHDLVLSGGFLYLAEETRVSRVAYTPGMTSAGSLTPIVTGLPGGGNHKLKNIAVAGDDLYVSIASASNADPADLAQNPKRGAIYRYSASTPNQPATSGTLYAQGIRNAEGLAFAPGSSDLWVVVNNRDNVAYPFHQDFDGDGSDDYGKVMQAYVDNHPPEEVIRVRAGGNYGWPFCNPNPDAGLRNMPFDRDVQNNADGSKLDCAAADRVTQGIEAHAAPLGATFWSGAQVPAAFKDALVVGLHGSWNRSTISGNRFIFFPYAGGSLGAEQDLVSGFLTPGRWGRPVDAAVAGDGGLYLSDDLAGAVYKLTPGR